MKWILLNYLCLHQSKRLHLQAFFVMIKGSSGQGEIPDRR
mgnify:FL=1